MIKLENFEVVGWEHALRGMRNPKNSWARSDSTFKEVAKTHELVENEEPREMYVQFDALSVGPNDRELMDTLVKGGPVHAKFRRMISVYVDITAPLYWWKEFDTYKVGTVANSCSTMHKIADKEFTMEDFSCERLITGFEKGYSDAHIYSHPTYHDNEDDIYPMDLMGYTVELLNVCRRLYNATGDKKYWWQMIQLLPTSYNQKRTVMLNYEVLANMYKWRKNHKLDEWVEFCKWIEELPYSWVITGAQEEEKDILSKVEAAYKALVEARDGENIDADAFGEAITDAIGYLSEVLE